MGCGEFLVKYILFFANLFFALAGLALLGIGIAVQLQISVITGWLDGSFQMAPISAIVVGSIVFLVAFFGCCGAIRESNCMLVVYAIFMIILMILKITMATMIFVKLDDFVADIPNWLNQAFSQNQTAFHDIESTFQCCGTVGYLSYGNLTLPPSCCGGSPCTILNAFDGCNSVMKSFFNTFGLVIGITAIAIGAIELVAVIFALCLGNHARNKTRRARY